jgi:hypothetical protein
MAVPPDLAAWLWDLSLEAHGARLVADHKLAFLRDVRHLDEQELLSSGLAKVEAKRFVGAAAKLGATQRFNPTNLSAHDAPLPGAPARVRALVVGINAYGSPVPGAWTMLYLTREPSTPPCPRCPGRSPRCSLTAPRRPLSRR